ncbi:hypothetical protein PIB30_089323 [Stylosanthes scabra]|uniref:Uncharacterized protein n=1 Tax=Stylosanthes scabra TaxID=79078 RepID=A0ABU6QUP2_9FABA|nr:hypothetical protein [Stylosanthes scabra]
MDAKVTGSSPSFKICKGSAESTQKGSTGRFYVAATFARREPYLDSFRVVVGLRKDNRRMGSGVIYYEIEKREKYEDSDERADSDLAVVKTRRYHFDDEPFIHPLHSVQFDPDRLYELQLSHFWLSDVEILQEEGTPLRRDPIHQGELVRHHSTLPLVLVDEVKGIEEVEKKEEEEEEEEDPDEEPSEEEMPTAPRVMEVHADEDYLKYLEELCHHPEYSPVHSSQAFAQNPSDNA